jgi:hypothetical protein
MVKNRFKTLTIKLKKKYKDIKLENDMLLKFMGENEAEAYVESESEHEPEEMREELEIDGLPVLESGREDEMEFDG